VTVEKETRAEQVESGWRDKDGFIGPYRPGVGPRSDPRGEFPTGPEVGERLPDIRCQTAGGQTLDLHADRADSPAVVLFYRSAVW
jgi:hypothetical protein